MTFVHAPCFFPLRVRLTLKIKNLQLLADKVWSLVERDPAFLEMELTKEWAESPRCWTWLGGMRGGPRITVCGINVPIRRYIWETFVDHYNACPGPFTFTCNNDRCVKHIRYGRQPTKKKKTKHLRGSQHPRATINEERVRRIRSLLNSGMRTGEVAQKEGLSPALVSRIKKGTLWKHV